MALNPLNLAGEAKELERQFQERGCQGSLYNPCPWVLTGTLPVIVSAPHAVIHPRHGRAKLNEPYTGALALQLHRRTGASAIIYAHTTEEDPNWGKPGPYKRNLQALSQATGAFLVLDLHGMNEAMEERLGSIEIGTAYKTTLLDRLYLLNVLEVVLKNAKFRYSVDRYFTANQKDTIAYWTKDHLAIPAMQLELGWSVRNAENTPPKYSTLFSALVEAIDMMYYLAQKKGHIPGGAS